MRIIRLYFIASCIIFQALAMQEDDLLVSRWGLAEDAIIVSLWEEKISHEVQGYSTSEPNLTGNQDLKTSFKRYSQPLSSLGKNTDNDLSLFAAIEEDKNEIALHIIIEGEYLQETDDQGWYAQHRCAMKGNNEILHALLMRGADVNARGPYNITPLICAAELGFSETVLLLLEAGAGPNCETDRGDTALHRVAQKNLETIVPLLLLMGADPDKRNGKKETPLHKAAASLSPGIVEHLLEERVECDALTLKNLSPLHIALLACGRRGSYIQNVCYDGISPNYSENGGRGNIHFLSRSQAKPSMVDWKSAMQGNYGKNLQAALSIIHMLVKRGASLIRQTPDGLNAMHLALNSRQSELVKFFLKHGCSLTPVAKCSITLNDVFEHQEGCIVLNRLLKKETKNFEDWIISWLQEDATKNRPLPSLHAELKEALIIAYSQRYFYEALIILTILLKDRIDIRTVLIEALIFAEKCGDKKAQRHIRSHLVICHYHQGGNNVEPEIVRLRQELRNNVSRRSLSFRVIKHWKGKDTITHEE